MSKKSTIDRQKVQHIARLANIALTADEEKRLESQLNQILEYFERLDQIDTSQVEAMSHSLALETPFAADEVNLHHTSLTNEEALAQAPEKEAGQFRVPVVIE